MLDLELLLPTFNEHYYTCTCTGMKISEKEFPSRQQANEYMYKQCKKHGLRIKEVWRDNHDITYICNDNVRFYVQRAY